MDLKQFVLGQWEKRSSNKENAGAGRRADSSKAKEQSSFLVSCIARRGLLFFCWRVQKKSSGNTKTNQQRILVSLCVFTAPYLPSLSSWNTILWLILCRTGFCDLFWCHWVLFQCELPRLFLAKAKKRFFYCSCRRPVCVGIWRGLFLRIRICCLFQCHHTG